MCKGQKQWGLVAQYARSHQLQLRQDEQNYESKMKNVRKCQYIWLIIWIKYLSKFDSFFWISGEFPFWRTPTSVNIIWANVIMISTSKKKTSLAKEAAFLWKKMTLDAWIQKLRPHYPEIQHSPSMMNLTLVWCQYQFWVTFRLILKVVISGLFRVNFVFCNTPILKSGGEVWFTDL